MGSEDKDAQYWLFNASRFTFFIKDKLGMTPVPDAEVLIDNALAGRTDSRGILTIPVKRGKMYTISIKKEGYQAITRNKNPSVIPILFLCNIDKGPCRGLHHGV